MPTDRGSCLACPTHSGEVRKKNHPRRTAPARVRARAADPWMGFGKEEVLASALVVWVMFLRWLEIAERLIPVGGATSRRPLGSGPPQFLPVLLLPPPVWFCFAVRSSLAVRVVALPAWVSHERIRDPRFRE